MRPWYLAGAMGSGCGTMRYLCPAMLTTLCELIRLRDVCSTEGDEEDGLPPLVRAAASLDEPR